MDTSLSVPRLFTGELNVETISTLGEPCEPFGELSFFKMIDVFYDKAYALAEQGCKAFLLEGISSLAELRAAVFACRKTELPVFVMMDVGNEDFDSMGGKELAFLISLQGMGISAFGLKPNEFCEFGIIDKLYKQLYPYATVPIFAKLEAGKVVVSEIREMLGEGVECFDCRDISEAELEVMRIEMERFDFMQKLSQKRDISFVVANEEQAFFLNPENIEFSPAIDIECDMADELLDFKDEIFDVIKIKLSSHDDGYHFSQNMHFLQFPVMFISDDVEPLRMALHYYNGRAIIDSQSEIDEEILAGVAEEFGAIIY